MKKQYMDFVPSGARIKVANKDVRRGTVGMSVVENRNVRSQNMRGEVVARNMLKTQINATNKVSFTGEKKPSLGKVENLNTRFVKSDVPKRPLSRSAHFTTGKTGIAAVKAQKVGLRNSTPVKPAGKSMEKSKAAKVSGATYQAPKSPFINQGQVEKRPLSAKNVYPKKKAKSEKKEPKGPVTIISKPEKQAHVGMIVTIILTIILGAAAGTVAFLLLPK